MKKKPNKTVTPEELEKAFEAIEDALRYSGKLLPIDEKFVILSGDEADWADLPDSLRDPREVLVRGRKILNEGFNAHCDTDVSNSIESALALAARNGTEITDEILQEMHKDRESAEKRRESNGKV